MYLVNFRSLSYTTTAPRRAVLHHTAVRAAVPRPCIQRHHHAARIVQVSAADNAATGSSAPEGQMNAALMEAMQAKIQEALEAERVTVADVYGDGRHVNIDVVSAAFEGKSSVAKQRMVYKAIWLELQDAVHAVDSMTTKTPAEAA
ncbi:bola protein [Scenedesmus sp. NREL 46B-D3]|nr:bola protein [Scenedesmus sp. NREL 46B-D3]